MKSIQRNSVFADGVYTNKIILRLELLILPLIDSCWAMLFFASHPEFKCYLNHSTELDELDMKTLYSSFKNVIASFLQQISFVISNRCLFTSCAEIFIGLLYVILC